MIKILQLYNNFFHSTYILFLQFNFGKKETKSNQLCFDCAQKMELKLNVFKNYLYSSS